MKRYFALNVSEKDRVANIDIYGDITSWEWLPSDVSSYTLSKALEELDVDEINVHINSYGGEVAEGLAIANKLKRHKAKVTTYCDGFACSIASVIFMAGEERIMGNASLLMIHLPWTRARGNAKDMEKVAEDLKTIGEASIKAYMEHVTISQEELEKMLEEETWISSDKAVLMGFATKVELYNNNGKPSQSAREIVMEKLLKESTGKENVVGVFKIECEHFLAGVDRLVKVLELDLQEDSSCEDKSKNNKLLSVFKCMLQEEDKKE